MLMSVGDKFDLRCDGQSFSHLWDQIRMGKQITYEERDKNDAYKAKDYAVGYEKSTSSTSRDINSSYNQDYSRGLGETTGVVNSYLGQNQQAKARITKNGEIDMDEQELRMQIEMYERLSQ
jgi:hypothetical protein